MVPTLKGTRGNYFNSLRPGVFGLFNCKVDLGGSMEHLRESVLQLLPLARICSEDVELKMPSIGPR